MLGLALALVATTTAQAQQLDWLERYALATNREAILSELIPGTQEHFYFHCLHYQVTGQLEKAEALLAKWKSSPLTFTESLHGIEDRQRLLTFGQSPERTIEHLRTRLNLRFDHPGPTKAGEQFFPAEFDNQTIAPSSLVDSTSLNELTQQGLGNVAKRVLSGELTLDPARFANLLNRVDGPWMDDLDKLVIKELQFNPTNRSFGDRVAHQWLTLVELQNVTIAVPSTSSADAMVAQTLLRLRPSDDTDMRQQPEIRSDYLQRVDEYVTTLPEAYISLKAATLYQRLQVDLALGNLNLDRFLRYLRMPRTSAIVIPRAPLARTALAEPTQDFTALAIVPPIGDEQPLVRTYLEHFLKDEDSTAKFDGLLKPEYLSTVFAETKLLHGVEPSERWYEMLDSNRRQQLRDRIELTLAPTNPRDHAADAPSTLEVDLKRVDQLVIRVYRINTHAYYRTRTNPIDTDIDLDGLVATSKRQIDYTFAPTRRHRETIELPEIKGRGVWIVDLLGGGLRARAMIRRGELEYAITQSPNGMRIIAVDENRKPVSTAKLIIAAQQWQANEEGIIDIPPLVSQLQRTAVLQDEDLATPLSFPHLAESYQLQAAMHVSRQQLQSSQQADLIIRPRLLMMGRPIDPETLENSVVTITATDLDGIASTRRYEDLKLNQAGEVVISLRVPPRLAELRAEMSGRVRSLADNTWKPVTATQSWPIATVRKTSLTTTAHLTRDQDNWLLETRGRTGEPVAGTIVSVTLYPSVRSNVVQATLQSDARGRIVLGPLKDIDTIQFVCEGQPATADLRLVEATWPTRLHAVSGNTIRLPSPDASSDVGRFRLVSLRADNRPEINLSDRLKLDAGMLSISELQAGNYQLIDQQRGTRVQIAVTSGNVVGNVAIGTVRQLELAPRSELGIASINRGDDGLKIKLTGVNSDTRVHLFAHRYHNASDPLQAFSLPELPTSMRGIWRNASGYISDLRLGEEYQYVLRRQLATKYPGVMLPQPGLILNPWETRSTNNETETVAEGQAPGAAAAPMAPMMDEMRRKQQEAIARESLWPDYDFLLDSGAVVTNLVPDKNGEITIPADVVAGMPHLQIIAADALTTMRRSLSAPLVDAELRDLRLAKHLELERALAFARGVVIASPGKPLDLKSLGTAQVQLYPSVGELLRLYMTLLPDARLKDFEPLVQWHTLDDAAKSDAYNQLASHELHLFLSVHDRDFFEKSIRPFLKNKVEKQLVDHYLLDEDLTPWTPMWRYRTLNAAEKVLLARRVPNMLPTVQREMREWVLMQPDQSELLRRLVESGLAGTAMSGESESRLDRSSLSLADGAIAAPAGANGPFGAMAADEPFGASEKSEELGMRRQRAARGLNANADKAVREEAKSSERFSKRMSAQNAQSFFRPLDDTKQWAESQWDRVRVTSTGSLTPLSREAGQVQGPELIPIDPFWSALAASGNETDGANEHLLRPTTTRHAALAALAFCGLPLKAGDIKLPTDDKPFTPPHPVALVTKRLVELEPMKGEASLLVGQRFSAVDNQSDSDPTADAPIAPDEFIIQKVYRGEVIITNPTPKRRTIDVLWQIPAGSIALASGQATDSKTLVIEPFAVQRLEYQFYFPKPGTFAHYPVCVGVDGRLVARGTQRTFDVVAAPTKIDEDSWPSVAAYGDAAKIATFLEKANLRKLAWDLVAHRMKDADIYQTITRVLRENQIEATNLWGYSLHHRDVDGMKTFLSQQPLLIASTGPVFRSDLLKVDPIDRQLHELLEYAPLVQARIHPLKAEREILNPTFKDQYVRFLRVLAHQGEIATDQEIQIVYYLILQNRIEEAIKRFSELDEDRLTPALQYDYLTGYLALHRGDYATAGQVATKHQNHTIPRWRERFRAMLANLNQRDDLMKGSQLASVDNAKRPPIDNSGDLSLIDRDQQNAAAADRVPLINVAVEGSILKIEHRNTSEVTINLYAVDLELLFSKTPFVRDDLATMAMVEPTRSERIELESKDGIKQFRLNDVMARQTLLVEVSSGAARATTLYYGGNLTAYVSQAFGQIQVTDSSNRQPVETAYVKVYARHHDGSIHFHKDGYTDLRGRFDYVSVSSGDLGSVQRFAILVIDPERGATLQEADPPTR
ncbi:MAG TPA: hypothetical protein DDZ51_30205 [Planctomycetaceae bacterium]|nr:hypothetical protein [Planctomycetaceae bacterium]